MDLAEWIGFLIIVDGPLLAILYYIWRKINEKV